MPAENSKKIKCNKAECEMAQAFRIVSLGRFFRSAKFPAYVWIQNRFGSALEFGRYTAGSTFKRHKGTAEVVPA